MIVIINNKLLITNLINFYNLSQKIDNKKLLTKYQILLNTDDDNDNENS